MTSPTSSPGYRISTACARPAPSMSRCDGSRHMREQFPPALRARVAGGDHRNRQRPFDRQVGIVVGNLQVLTIGVRSIDAMADVGGGPKRLHAGQEAGWDVQVKEVVVVEAECLLHTEGRRIPADV